MLLHVPLDPFRVVTVAPEYTAACPRLSTIAQNAVESQDTPVRSDAPDPVWLQLEASVGAWEMSTFPALSTAMHNEVETHDTEVIVWGPSMVEVVHVPAGSVATAILPEVPTSTHRPLVEVVPGAQESASPVPPVSVTPLVAVHAVIVFGVVV